MQPIHAQYSVIGPQIDDVSAEGDALNPPLEFGYDTIKLKLISIGPLTVTVEIGWILRLVRWANNRLTKLRVLPESTKMSIT